MNKSRLFVFQLKEIIYTVMFIILTIILIIVLVNMFGKKPKPKTKETLNYEICYNPGVYSTEVNLDNSVIDVCVTLDSNNIKSITLNNLNETITTMYPLLEPSVEYIETQLASGVSINDIKLDDSSKYTQNILLQAISTSLDKAKVR